MTPEPHPVPPPARPVPGRAAPHAQSAPHTARGATPRAQPAPHPASGDATAAPGFPARYDALRRALTGDGWALTGPAPAPRDAGVYVYTLTAPDRAVRDGLTGDGAASARLRRIRLVVPTQVGFTCVKLTQNDQGQLAWQAVADFYPDPAVLLAAARAAQAVLPGADAADTRTTGQVLTRCNWSHSVAPRASYFDSHHYISPGHDTCALQATYLPPTYLSQPLWWITPAGGGRITTLGQIPTAIVNALLLTPAHTAPDTDTKTGV